jgi:hypothetical protein
VYFVQSIWVVLWIIATVTKLSVSLCVYRRFTPVMGVIFAPRTGS